MTPLRLFLLCFIIAVAFIYGLRIKGKSQLLIPGDIYIEKQGIHIYIPVSSALLIAIILFIIFNSIFNVF